MGRGWVRGGQFTSKLRPRWTDPVTARRVPSKWKRERGGQGEQGEQGEQGGMSKEEREKQGECAMYIRSVFMYIMNVCASK